MSKKKTVKKKSAKKAIKIVRKAVKKVVKAAPKFQPTPEQRRALKRSTSWGVKFYRRKPIRKAKGSDGRNSAAARNPGKDYFVSIRRFGSENEALIHGKRFTKIEGHRDFEVMKVKAKPNAWVNLKTRKTNPVIGAKRVNRG